METWVRSGSPAGRRYWQQQSWKVPLGVNGLLEVAISPTISSALITSCFVLLFSFVCILWDLS